jgi:HPr kinase/phosphorylase
VTDPAADRLILHATTVAVDSRGLLILGPSGSGKSSLALQMIALGAELIADDQSLLVRHGTDLVAHCPPILVGRIEARGLGILACPARASARLVLAIDLGVEESHRLPPRRSVSFLGATLDLVFRSQGSHLPAALMCYLKGGRAE